MATAITCVIILTVCVSIRGFNIDTTIPIVKEGPPGSFFGYSVAQHQQVRMIDPFRPTDEVIANYLLVGAPKLNIPEATENFTGGIYKCNAVSPRTDDCQLLLQNEYSAASKPDKGRSDQWLGVVVRSGGVGKEVVACAHRYKTTNNNFGIGTCYQMSQDLQFNREQGQGNMISPCKGYSTRNEHKEYAFCQGGTSAYISDERRLILGSPGAIDWRGMVSEMDISPLGLKRWYKSPTTESDNPSPPVATLSMLGYSVVGGKFDSTGFSYYVAGAPRSEVEGQVVMFTEMNSGNLLKYEKSQLISGDLAFSGFGQDLIALDLNNDTYDDLVVACPMYHKKEKDNIRVGGAIYVYIGNGDRITDFTKPQIIKGRSLSQDECDALQCLHARFGFSLAKAGDLNGDGFQDFAVGAPYEGQGAVYIYHGSAEGVQEPFSQRIYASQLPDSANWTTFGYSLSGGMDLDDNTYPDILVGSYDVDKVALLRTRPIIYLHSKITVSPEKLNMSADSQKECEYDGTAWYCVQLKLCLRYTAEPAERFDDTVDIIYKIVAEPDRINPRVEFKQGTGSRQVIEDTFKLLPQKLTGLSSDTEDPKFACLTQIAYLKDKITDVLSSIEFGISYRLPERTEPIPTPYPGALPDINAYPILDAGLTQEETMVITTVEFVKKCGENQICESNLVMDVNLNLRHDLVGKPVLELGITKTLKVHVSIENTNEIAYQAAFYLLKPEKLTWQGAEPRSAGCEPVPNNNTLIECRDIGSKELGKPLKRGAIVDFTLNFGTENVTTIFKEIELIAWVNTTSKEMSPEADTVKIPIRVLVNADMLVSGKSEPDSAIPYSGTVRGESAMLNEHMIGQSVNHTFTVFNLGPGTVEASEITIRWPYELASAYPHGKHLLYLMQPPQVLSGDAVCFDQPDIINPANIQEDYALNIRPQNQSPAEESGPAYILAKETRRRKRQVDEETDTGVEEPIEIRAEDPRTGEVRGKKKSVLLDCETGTAKCHDIRCKIGTLLKNKMVQIRIRSRLWESTLLEDFRHVDEVLIQSMAKLHIRPEYNVVQSDTTNDIGRATSIAIPSLKIAPKKQVDWWIYVVAVLGGIILLIIIALLLWKCGFFERKKPSPTYNAKLEKNYHDTDAYASSPIYNAKAEKTYHPDERFSFVK